MTIDPADTGGASEPTARIGTGHDEGPAVVVLGHLRVDPADRDQYLAACRDIIVAARVAPGCMDFHLSADPLEGDRINVVERWASAAAVEAFRGAGAGDEQTPTFRSAAVDQIEVGVVVRL